jgi:UPF0755 protein
MIQHLIRRLKTHQGRQVVLGLVGLFFVWMLVRCSDDRFRPPALIYLPEGSQIELLHALQDQSIPIDIDEIQTTLHDHTIVPGWVRFNPHVPLSPERFFQRLFQPQREPTRRVVMFSGETIQLFAKQLAAQTLLSESKLLNAYYRHSPYSDGGILAGHYAVPYKTTPNATMYALVAQSETAFRTLTKRSGVSYDPIDFKYHLTIASIIQKETWHTQEMPRIASVIANRLERGMKLQLDATLNYGPYAHTPVTPERIRTDASRYNTYRYSGLPPQPISSVTQSALKAAFYPAKTSYLFFVRNAQGTHDFANTYTEHRANIARIKAEKERQTHEKNATVTADKL